MTELAVKIPSPASSEAVRSAALRAFAILDTEPETAFADLAKMAARICQAPFAFITFVDEQRQWFKASVGADLRSTPLDAAFCTQALLQGLLIVPDALEDPRFACNPFVHGEPELRFYAGAVIRTDEGLPLGTVCVLDRVSRPNGLTQDQAETLPALADAVVTLLKLRRAESALAERREAFSTLADALPHITWPAGRDGYDECTNRRWYEFTGAPAGAASETGWIEMLHPDDRDRTWARWQLSAGTGEPYEATCRLRHHSGAYRWTLARALPTYDEQGRITRWFGTYTDIHEWKLAETAAAQSHGCLARGSGWDADPPRGNDRVRRARRERLYGNGLARVRASRRFGQGQSRVAMGAVLGLGL